MVWYIVAAIILIGGGYYLGCKFPPSFIKRKIINDWQDSLDKTKKAQ